MSDSYDLTKLGPEPFQNLVNLLALRVLGFGNTGFGPGADGGRDGFFEGEAPYPSEMERWKGRWYIQSKFHKSHLSKDPQKWLIQEVKKEIEAFEAEESDRSWPNNWIIATNIDPSGKPETGSFDAIRAILKKRVGNQKINLAIWGGRKILDLLAIHEEAANYYAHFLTPGHVLTALYKEVSNKSATYEEIIRYFVATQFSDNLLTKLEQAGSSSDVRPSVHDLFIDLPYLLDGNPQVGILAQLCKASAQCNKYSLRKQVPDNWSNWSKQPQRARVCLIKGGPGQGKSTVGQYLSQINRACLILDNDGPMVIDTIRQNAQSLRTAAERDGLWPTSARIPIQIELKEFAHWYSQRPSSGSHNLLTYIAETVTKKIGSNVSPKHIKNTLSKSAWIVVFDGLDEVPNDSKNAIAEEVIYFVNDVVIEIDGDVLAICTSRPQGYSGQFASLDGPVVELSQLDVETAMQCAKPLLRFGRSADDAEKSITILEEAISSANVRELMTTPLQSHIMAVVVRDGGRPPERRWQLFHSFYHVMKKRESQKNFPNARIAKLLREEDRLLKSVHMRLGFVLHARAERSEGAQTTLSKSEFKELVNDVVVELVSDDIEATVSDVMEATTERLVLVSTPESGNQVRFDIRQLQEFFAAEFLYAGVDATELRDRIEVIGGDAHWREVMHFLMSALIENQRTSDVAVAVQALRQLNEGRETDNNALYHRRTGKGVLLANRLLTEGVLEQDQRDRQQLKPLFDTLGGILNLYELKALRKLCITNELPRSRQWLVHALLEKLAIASSQESAGALFVLGWLSINNETAQQVLNHFENMAIKWQETIFRFWVTKRKAYSFRREEEYLISKWVVQAAVNILNSESWLLYSQDVIAIMIKICGSKQSELFEVFIANGLSKQLAQSIFTILNKDDMHTRGGGASKKELDCGPLLGSLYKENWINKKIPSHLTDFPAEEYVNKTGGYFKLLFTAIWFAKARSLPTLTELIRIADAAGADKFGCLPDHVAALIPVEGKYSLKPFVFDHLREVKVESELDAKCSDLCPPCSDLHLNLKKDLDQNLWNSLACNLPALAINISLVPEILPWGEHPPFTSNMRDLLENNPDKVADNILFLGELIKDEPELFQILVEKISALPCKKRSYKNIHGEILKPFKVNLAAHASLLVVIAPALIAWIFNEMSPRPIRRGLTLHNILDEYGFTFSQLRNICVNSTYSSETRAGALAISWLIYREHELDAEAEQLEKLNLAVERTLYEEVLTQYSETWLTAVLVNYVLPAYSEDNPDALAIVSLLLEKCQDGGGPRDQLITLLENWREVSLAPVQSRQALEKWLSYSFQEV